MRAWVCWHSREFPTYGAGVIESHATLAALEPSGWHGSFIAAVSGASWIAGGGRALESWFLVEDVMRLFALADPEISGVPSSRAVRRLNDQGEGGIYRLVHGEVDLAHGGAGESAMCFSSWFRKPDDVDYETMYSRLQRSLRNDVTLWSAERAPAPRPEFCLRSAEPLELPPQLRATTLSCESICSWRTRVGSA